MSKPEKILLAFKLTKFAMNFYDVTHFIKCVVQ